MRQSCIDGAEEQRSEQAVEHVQIVHYCYSDDTTGATSAPWLITLLPASGRKADPDFADALDGDIIVQDVSWGVSQNAGHKIEAGNQPMAGSERRSIGPRTAIVLGTCDNVVMSLLPYASYSAVAGAGHLQTWRGVDLSSPR